MTGCPSEAQLNAVRQGQHLTPDEIAAVLDRWRPHVLREMGRQRLWRGTDVSAREDQFQDVAAVLRALYSAQHKVDQVAALMVAGRLCARRQPAVEALARLEARGPSLAQARAHLAYCQDCLLAFREYRSALGRKVAGLLPVPLG